MVWFRKSNFALRSLEGILGILHEIHILTADGTYFTTVHSTEFPCHLVCEISGIRFRL